MGKSLTFEEVKTGFENRGYELLETEYIRAITPMKFKCPKHPDKELSISYNKLKNGRGCKYCSKERVIQSMRHSVDKVKQDFENRGYVLLETNYENSKIPLRYKCLKHPDEDLKIAYTSLLSGNGCKYCGRERVADSKRLPFNVVAESFKDRGYELLEQEYKDDRQRLRFRCPKHPDEKTYITFNNFRKGAGCIFCKQETLREVNLKHKIEDIKIAFKKRGYQLLETEYVRYDYPMKFRCSKHPDKNLSVRLGDFLKGQGCQKCGVEKRSRENSYNWRGGTSLLSSYLRVRLKSWAFESMKKHNFTCFVSGEKGGHLEVHHTVSFHTIRDLALKSANLDLRASIGDYTLQELHLLGSKLKKLHDQIEGVPLRKDIHTLFHKLYGKENNTPEQLYEFKIRWQSGEFDKKVELENVI